eukprot:6484003-Amphidinium_carterae.1
MAFEGHCGNCGHNKCVITRTAKPRQLQSGAFSDQGRPLGAIMAWLQFGDTCTREEHWSKELWAVHLAYDRRVAAREALKGIEGSAALLELERPPHAGEGEEPMSSLV